MSEPKLISPMLDNFVMGDPISEHDGVQCCPAMEKDSDNKYIVKVISVPASQTKVDALLLSGACSSQEDALAYFKELSENIAEEAEILKKLSDLEGFTPISNWQIVPMDDGVGFDVYMLSEYRNTLQQALRRGCMTHLSALNLGLDICAALSLSRRAGYLYADLKPSNVYLTGENTYRIGDLGFIKLDSLMYTSLPDRYRSQYTAPEIADAYSSLNTTVDVYAAGLILYQVFNDGQLPVRDDTVPEDTFAPPAYADYEMAEIILKACAADPADRWQDPMEMGQALVAYMQRNGAHNTPIIPEAEAEEVLQDEPAAEYEPSFADEETDADPSATDDEAPTEEEIPVVTEESIYTEDSEGNLTFIEDTDTDETAPHENVDEVDYDEVTEEVSDMLEQADELIAHDAPEPVVQPEPIDVPIPPPLTLEKEPEEEAEDEISEDNSGEPAQEAETTEQNEPVEDEPTEEPEVRKASHWIRNTILIILALALIAGGIFFYKVFYLQAIDSILLETSDEGVLTVLVSSEVPEDKLTVICTDTYGIQVTSPVVDGKAVFTDLTPNSAYTVKVNVSGFHRLTGDTSAAYTTPTQTEIVQFTAVTGSEDGSVVLSFTIDGPDSELWQISYKADADSVQTAEFAGHMLTLTGLPVGQELTFTLEPENEMHITGINQVAHTVSRLITAKNISVSAIVDNKLTAQWEAPDGVNVDSWTVRCYNDGFDKTIVTEEATASFEVTDAAASYTIEVTASGMSVSERAFIAKNSVGVQDFKIDNADPNSLALSWNPIGELNTENWVLQYTMNGSAAQEIPLQGENSASLSPVVPGCKYIFTLKTGDGAVVLGGTQTYNVAAAAEFEGYGVSAADMEFRLCRTPSWSNWDHYDISDSDYTSSFASDENASLVVRLHHAYNTSWEDITTLYVIRDENGGIVSVSSQTDEWSDMWYRNYCELDIPKIPTATGSYTLNIYFNGQLAGQANFDIVD